MDASTGMDAAGLLPSSYAPYCDPRDYILSWTEAIWAECRLDRLAKHCDKRVKIHTAYGDIYEWNYVVQNSLQQPAAFPNGDDGHGEDDIWEVRGLNGSISSHRVLKTGTHTGCCTYGPVTRTSVSVLTASHYELRDGKVLGELRIYDEIAILAQIHAGRVASQAEA